MKTRKTTKVNTRTKVDRRVEDFRRQRRQAESDVDWYGRLLVTLSQAGTVAAEANLKVASLGAAVRYTVDAFDDAVEDYCDASMRIRQAP